MIRKFLYIVMLVIGLAILAACGLSPEEQATLTAAAWTPTPTITPSPTPLPIDLSVQVQDQEGNPIEGVNVTLVEMQATETTDAKGLVSWEAIPSNGVSLVAKAQGFLVAQTEASLENGPNEVTLALEKDPYGLQSGDGCGPGEVLLYLEDFQDQEVPTSWASVDNQTEGWGFAEVIDQPGNWAAANSSSELHPFMRLGGRTYRDAAWRFFYFTTDVAGMSFNWLHSNEPYETDSGLVEDARYQLVFDNAQENHIEIRHLEIPVANYPLTRVRFVPAPLEWHLVEISTLGDVVQVWVDGDRYSYYTDPNPLPEASLSVEFFETTPPDTTLYIDNMSVCELTEPFVSIFAPPTGDE